MAADARINDLPIEIGKEMRGIEEYVKCNQEKVLGDRAAQIALAHCRKDKVMQKIQELIRDYIVALAGHERFKGLEPNF